MSLGELISFSYSPGYNLMIGDSHVECLRKGKSGEWKIQVISVGQPTILREYMVAEEELKRFIDFLKERNVVSLSTRQKGDLFMLDYSPWNYCIVFNNASVGGNRYKSYNFDEYLNYNDDDRALLNEIKERWKALQREMISKA